MTGKFLDEKVEKRAGKVLIFLFLFFIVFSIGLSQNNNAVADDEKKLREEILAAYQSKGEQAVRDFFKNKKEKITQKFIADFAKAGLRKENMSWLKICEIIAEEKRDKWMLGDVYTKMSNILFPPDYKNAKLYLEKALKIYVELKDPEGQGRVYIGKGIIASLIERNKKAMEMFEKAKTLLAKANDHISQGNLCLAKSTIYIKNGEKVKALETYDRAIQFFEKKSYSVGIGNAYYAKGDIYSLLSEYSMALKMYDKALPYYVKIDFFLGQGNVYKSKGEVYFNKGDYVNSEEWNDKAMALYKKVGAPLGQGSVLQQKGDIYFIKGDMIRQKKCMRKRCPFMNNLDHLRQ
jgi:tetratricopeptide (TPR) repeat protein